MLGILRIVKIFEIVNYVMLIYIKRTYSLIERECVECLKGKFQNCYNKHPVIEDFAVKECYEVEED